MTKTLSLSQHDWSLHRKGPMDQARHNQKVKEAIKGNLGGIVGEESIISSDGKRIMKIPLRSLELPKFRFDDGKRNHTGQGNGDSHVGDVIGQDGQAAQPGRGSQPGQIPGIDYYEAEISVDELADLVFEDLGLPYLKPKSHQEIVSEELRFDEIRRKGVMSNLDKRRTVLENLRRNAVHGDPHLRSISNDDLRFRTWERRPRPESSAVVIAMRDVSGSMGEFEKYISRSFYFWMVRFLRTKYETVQIVFITHHTDAKEVDEEAFFNLGESGGTKVSSAYQLATEIVNERYDPSQWNIYPFHFSDGDNWGEMDNQRCLELVRGLLEKSAAFGYGEIQEGGRRSNSTLMNAFEAVQDERFIRVTIASKDEVYPALRTFFAPRDLLTGAA
jgi:uncharacterized protein